MEEKTTDNRNTFAIKTFLKDYLDLRKDKDNELETVDSIRKGVEFKGANLWILIFAIFMASLGLNAVSYTHLPLSDFIRAVGRAPTKLVSTPNSPTT